MQAVRTVLHVDDDPDMLDLVRNVLRNRGYKVVSVSDPLLALPTLKKAGTKVVLLDIDMPGKDGISVLKEIKEYDGSIRVIMVTGLVTMGVLNQAARLGAEDFVFKPIDDLWLLREAVDRAHESVERCSKSLYEWFERKKLVADPS